jgi:hypothetical protein
MQALEADGPLQNSFIHMVNVITLLSSMKRILHNSASRCSSFMPISAHDFHFPAIFAAAPVLCESPRSFEPPALALD